MQSHPSYHFARASPLPLDVKCLFLVGSNILLSMAVQPRDVILEFLQDRMSHILLFCHLSVLSTSNAEEAEIEWF